MTAALRTEFRKILTTRTWWILTLCAMAYVAMMAVILAASFVFGNRAAAEAGDAASTAVMSPTDLAISVYTLGVSLGYILPAILGVLVVTTEFRHHTITPTLLAEPRRSRVLGAKLLAVIPFGLAVAVASVLGGVVAGAITLGFLDESTMLGDSAVQGAIVRSVLALLLWSLIGVGFGTVLTNQIAAIVVLLAFTQFVEPLLRLLLANFDATATASKLLPGAAGEAVAGSSLYSSSGLADLLTVWQGALVLVGYALLLVLIGRFTTFRRDIG